MYLCPSIRLPVSLFVTRRYSVETVIHIILKLQTFLTVDRHTIQVFAHQTVWQYTDGDPLTTWASNARGLEKSRFSTNISLYLGNINT